MPLKPDPSIDNPFLTRTDVRVRDKTAYLLEFLNERELQQVAEYCIDHIDSDEMKRVIAEYARM